MPVPSINVISGGSHASNLLACLEFLIVLTGAGIFAEDTVYHIMKFGHQDARWDMCNVGDETGFAPSLQLPTESLELDQCVLPRCERRVVSWTWNVFCSSRFPCPIQLCAETCFGEKCLTPLRNQVCLKFLAKREDDAFDDERLKVSVRGGLFNETNPCCVSIDGNEFNPTNTSSVSDTPGCSFVHVDQRHV